MKIDRSKPTHWLYLGLFTLNVCIALILRRLGVIRTSNRCLLYGHKFNGNLRAIYDRALHDALDGPEFYFLSMDPSYCAELQRQNLPVICALSPSSIPSLAAAFGVVVDHGLHSLAILLYHSDLKFFDTGHAIMIKGFDEVDFRQKHDYCEVWVSSSYMGEVHSQRFGVPPAIVRSIGYPRTDCLIETAQERAALLQHFDIEATVEKIFLFAPTWKQDDPGRDIMPFGEETAAFMSLLDDVCKTAGATGILRTHLNSADLATPADSQLLFRPHGQYPDTELLLSLTDCLVTDWSSIGFDFLLLRRPMIYLDIPHPFAKGLSIPATHRCGPWVSSSKALADQLKRYLLQPELYMQEYGDQYSETMALLYDHNADGHASRRAVDALAEYI